MNNPTQAKHIKIADKSLIKSGLKDAWDQGKIGQGASLEYTLPNSDVYADLTKKVIAQEVLSWMNFKEPDTLFYNSKEEWIDGLKSYVRQSLFNLEAWKDVTSDLTISDFNAAENDKKELIVQTTEHVYLKYKLYDRELIDAFTNKAKLGEFVAQKIENARQTWMYYWIQLYYNFVWAFPTTNTDKPTGKPVIAKPSFDKTENPITVSEKTTEAGMKKLLQYIRGVLISLQYPSKSHLALDDEKYPYANMNGENLVLLVNKDIYTLMSNLTAQLFNKNDVLTKLEMRPVDISLIKGYVEADHQNYLCVLYDKRKYRKGVWVDMLTKVTNLPKFRILTEMYTDFGFASLDVFPAYLYKAGPANSSKK